MAKQRMQYIDVANVLAIIAVLYLHCNGIVHHYTPTSAWAQSLVIEVLCYWAVPIFFMNSGITLLNYRSRYSTRTFFKKRFMGAMLPFLFWSVVFLIYYQHSGRLQIGSVKEGLNAILLTKVEPTFWFFLPLFGLYLWMPVFNALKERRDVIRYLAVISVLFVSVITPIFTHYGIATISASWMGIANGNIIFVPVGIIINEHVFTKRERYTIYGLAVLACIIRYGFTYQASMAAGQTVFRFSGYTGIPSLILGAAVFIFIKSVDWEARFGARFVNTILPKLSSLTLGVYILHMFIYRWLVNAFGINQSGMAWRLLGPIAIYLIGIALAAAIKKVPYLRRTMP